MKLPLKSSMAVILAATTLPAVAQTSLANAYRDYWYTGVSVNQWQVEADATGASEHDVTGQVSNDQTADWPIITSTFNWVVAENCMKCEVIHPKEGVYDFTLADKFVDKAKAAGMKGGRQREQAIKTPRGQPCSSSAYLEPDCISPGVLI